MDAVGELPQDLANSFVIDVSAHYDVKRRALDWIERLGIGEFAERNVEQLSGGQKQMLAVARAMVEPRDLLIVDEPSKGLAPAIVQNMIDAFQKMKASGVSILLVEQNIHFAQQLGDSVAVMDNGQVVHAGGLPSRDKIEAWLS